MKNITYPENYTGKIDLYAVDDFLEQLNTESTFFSVDLYDNECEFVVSYLYEGKRKINSMLKKIPEKHTIDFFQKNILKIQERVGVVAQYRSMKKYFSEKYNNFRIYATSFGLSVVVVCRNTENVKADIELIKKELHENGIEFKTEFSNANWVYRFIFRKKQENIVKLEKMF